MITANPIPITIPDPDLFIQTSDEGTLVQSGDNQQSLLTFSSNNTVSANTTTNIFTPTNGKIFVIVSLICSVNVVGSAPYSLLCSLTYNGSKLVESIVYGEGAPAELVAPSVISVTGTGSFAVKFVTGSGSVSACYILKGYYQDPKTVPTALPSVSQIITPKFG